jgi:hypothetical protein
MILVTGAAGYRGGTVVHRMRSLALRPSQWFATLLPDLVTAEKLPIPLIIEKVRLPRSAVSSI